MEFPIAQSQRMRRKSSRIEANTLKTRPRTSKLPIGTIRTMGPKAAVAVGEDGATVLVEETGMLDGADEDQIGQSLAQRNDIVE